MAKTEKSKKETKEKNIPEATNLVDKDNKVIYDGDAELGKIMDKVEVKEEDLQVPEVIQEAIDSLQTSGGLDDKVNESPETAKEFAESEIAKVEEIQKKLEKDIEERESKLTDEQKEKLEKLQSNTRTFWNGFSDGWF